MIPLVKFPEVVEHNEHYFSQVFSAEALIQFKRYISGLIVSENKTVEGINRLFVVESRNQSSLNRLITASPYSREELNDSRLAMLDSQPKTRIKEKGVISVDDTLLIHYGQAFDEIAKLYDPNEQRYVWAHDLVSLHYSDNDTDYPLDFQLWKPVDLERLEQGMRAAGIPFKPEKEALKQSDPRKWRAYLVRAWKRRQKQYPQIAELYEDKLVIARQLLQRWVEKHPNPKLAVTFDSWYTQADFCRFIAEELKLDYVGTLSEKEQVLLKTGSETLGSFAARLREEHLQNLPQGGAPVFQTVTINYKGSKETYYAYCHNHNLHNFGKQRLVINYRQADLSDDPAFFISNRFDWQAPGITSIRRHRWPVEVYYEEGKEEGLDQYQLRDFEAIQRHVALVAVVYSLLRAAQHDPVLRTKLQQQLEITLQGSVAAWRRFSQADALWALALFISAGLAQGQSLHQVMAPLIRAIAYS